MDAVAEDCGQAPQLSDVSTAEAGDEAGETGARVVSVLVIVSLVADEDNQTSHPLLLDVTGTKAGLALLVPKAFAGVELGLVFSGEMVLSDTTEEDRAPSHV